MAQEPVPLTTRVDPVAANGAVEKWLVQVEDAMLESIRDQSFQRLVSSPSRIRWALGHLFGLVVLSLECGFSGF